MMTVILFIRNSILKHQYGQIEGWTYSFEDNVWFYDGITADTPDVRDLVNDVEFNYDLLP